MKGEEEWTTVTRKQQKNKRRLKTRLLSDYQDNDITPANQDSLSLDNESKSRLICLVEDCMDALQNDSNSSVGTQRNQFDLDSLLSYIENACPLMLKSSKISPSHQDHSNTDETSTRSNKSSPSKNIFRQKVVEEIVSYGIGNFDPSFSQTSINSSISSSRFFSAPLIQLACILLLRQIFAMEYHRSQKSEESHNDEETGKDGSETRNENGKGEECSFLSYSKQQDLIPMYYFEPLISPRERIVLEEHFCVKVLQANEHGKRLVREEIKGVEPCMINDKGDKGKSTSTHAPTLFYMPHCPMRLYSNVLWKNWSPDHLCNLIILGNSLKAYDDRMSSIEQRRDETNAIFPLLPYLQEEMILSTTTSGASRTLRSMPMQNRKKSNRYISQTAATNKRRMTKDRYECELSRDKLESAFNDCAIISFSFGQQRMEGPGLGVESSVDSGWPKRPREHFAEEGEEML